MGNPTNYMGATMSWYARQMQSYSKNGTEITYKYDTNGLRTEKTVNGIKHEYYYVDGQLRFERNGDSYEIYYNYDADGRPVRAYKKDLVTGTNYSYYLITNTRGDVIETRNGSGEVNAKFTYDAWGKIISVTDGSGNELSSDSFAYQISLKYRGYVYDSETGLYYLQSRYYDPETGRFLNADDVDYIGYSGEQLSYNAFAYCENEPVCRVDVSGRASSKKKKTKYYVMVYTYNVTGKWDLGHTDFSVDSKIYSYGTINNDNNPELDNTKLNKLCRKVPGYIMTSKVENWQNYLRKDKKEVEDKVRIYLNKSEYTKLKQYIRKFLKNTTYSFTSKKIEYYKVNSGDYKYYSFTKANCSTFVRDALYACLPQYVNSQVPRVSVNGYNSIYMPDNVFGLAKLVGEIK